MPRQGLRSGRRSRVTYATLAVGRPQQEAERQLRTDRIRAAHQCLTCPEQRSGASGVRLQSARSGPPPPPSAVGARRRPHSSRGARTRKRGAYIFPMLPAPVRAARPRAAAGPAIPARPPYFRCPARWWVRGPQEQIEFVAAQPRAPQPQKVFDKQEVRRCQDRMFNDLNETRTELRQLLDLADVLRAAAGRPSGPLRRHGPRGRSPAGGSPATSRRWSRPWWSAA